MNFGVVTGFFSKYAIQVLGGALAASLLLNVGLGVGLKHYIGEAASVKTAVVATNKAATERKVIVEKRQDNNVVQTQDRTTSRIAAVTDSLRSNRPKPYLSPSKPGTPGASAESSEAVLLPPGSVVVDGTTYYRDQEICLTNTVLAEEWQTFYRQQVTIQEEENVGTNK